MTNIGHSVGSGQATIPEKMAHITKGGITAQMLITWGSADSLGGGG